MSSPISLHQTLGTDALDAFSAAAVQVAEDSLFAFAEPCTADAFADSLAARVEGESWITASVAFRGPFQGHADVSLPREVATELCAAFSGASADELDARQIDDFTGEFANMACGLWLTRMHNEARFDLSAPRLLVTERPVPSATDSATGFLLVNDAPLVLTLSAVEGGH